VIGSSHNPEESNFFKAMVPVWEKHPNIKVVLAPRHPERFNEVAGILQKNQINFRRLSQKQPEGYPVRVILIDAMGLLRKCYQLADVAIVAGSYTTKVGGHNVLEPSWYGVPVIFGPYMFNQPDLVDLVKEYGAGLQVSMEDLPRVVNELFEDAAKRKALGDGGLKLVGDVRGATKKTATLIKQHCG
jgi:3-deoxy-D-manno-octulosonic-acid transferase